MKKLILLLLLTPAVGCVHFQPIGPFAGSFGAPPQMRTTPEGARVKELGPNMAAVPLMRPAPPPPLPAMMVTPSDVTLTNHQEAAQRLMQELETDRKAMNAMPSYAEVSVVRGK
ncbi:MAG: hypothetical protein LC104_21855 [Bacteroidales bacterium]|nr:hypothetical protein [Bacteroidales bacterium]